MGERSIRASAALLRLAVCALVLPVALACGGDSSPTSTPTPVMVSANVFTPAPTAESPGTGSLPDETTPEPTLTPAPTYTPNPSPTPEPTFTPQPTYTPVPTATVPPAPGPTFTPQPTYTPVPTATPYPTPTPQATLTPVVDESPFGKMRVFEFPSGSFQVQVPESWTESLLVPSYDEVFAAAAPDGNSEIFINESSADISGYTQEDALKEAADLFEAGAVEDVTVETVSRETVQTSQGFPAVRLEFSAPEGRLVSLVYVSENGLFTFLNYVFFSDDLEEGRRMADYFFSTFRVN